jgi:copper chaperone CopZ
MASCGNQVTPNATITLELSGPCSECPPEISINLVKSLHGIAEATYDPKEKEITIQFDSLQIKKNDIILALNENGFEVDLSTLTSAKFYPDCCDLSEADDELSLDEEDLDIHELDVEFDNMDVTAEIEAIEEEVDKMMEEIQIDDSDLKDLNLKDD